MGASCKQNVNMDTVVHVPPSDNDDLKRSPVAKSGMFIDLLLSPTVQSLLSDENVIHVLQKIKSNLESFVPSPTSGTSRTTVDETSVTFDQDVVCSIKHEEIVERTPSPQGMGHRKRIVSHAEMQEVFTSPTNKKRKTVYCIDTMESTDANIVKALDFNSPSPKPKTVSIGKKPSTKVKDTEKSYEHLRQIAAVKHDIIKHANAFLKFKKAPKHVNIVHDQLKKLNLNMMDNPDSDQLTNSFFHVMAYQTPEYWNLHPDKQHDLLMKKMAAYIGVNPVEFQSCKFT